MSKNTGSTAGMVTWAVICALFFTALTYVLNYWFALNFRWYEYAGPVGFAALLGAVGYRDEKSLQVKLSKMFWWLRSDESEQDR